MNHQRTFAAAVLAFLTTLTVHAAGPEDFTVTSPIDGKTFKLSEARGHYVALHFLLKTECPFCLRHTAGRSRADSGPKILSLAAGARRTGPGSG